MSQKRPLAAPLPIFNKSKRPRQALVAHPKNPTYGEVASRSKYSSGHINPRPSSMRTFGFSEQQENRPPFQNTPSYGLQPARFTPFQHVTKYSETSRISSRTGSKNVMFQQSTVNDAMDASLHPLSTKPVLSAASAAVGIAKEPTTCMGAKLPVESGHLIHKRKPSLRVLTATAQGMQHWSKYKHHTPLLFEVFGMVVTPVTMVASQAKQFSLRTSDGVVTCQFWEMDRPLPHLVRGHTYRVVGQWDTHLTLLKCYSVRQAHKKEEKCLRQAVEVADRSMRKFVATLNEM